MVNMDTNNNLKIIEPEISNFSRDIHFERDKMGGGSKDLSQTRIFNKLFCRRYNKSVWFHEGKLYRVQLAHGEINVIEDKSTSAFEDASSSLADQKIFWSLLVILAFLSPNISSSWLIIILAFASLFQDRVENFICWIRINLIFY